MPRSTGTCWWSSRQTLRFTPWARNSNRVSLPPVWVSRDPQQDTFSLAWQGSLMELAAPEGRLKGVEIFTTAAGETALADQLGPVDSWDLRRSLQTPCSCFGIPTPPTPRRLPCGVGMERIPVLWAGATGWLTCCALLRTARYPLTLLDLKAPVSLSALDYIGGLHQVQRWAAQGNLTLPESLPGFYPLAASSPTGLGPPSPVALSQAARGFLAARSGFQAGAQPVYFRPAAGRAG